MFSPTKNPPETAFSGWQMAAGRIDFVQIVPIIMAITKNKDSDLSFRPAGREEEPSACSKDLNIIRCNSFWTPP